MVGYTNLWEGIGIRFGQNQKKKERAYEIQRIVIGASVSPTAMRIVRSSVIQNPIL
jgi:hypothetical protein